MRKIILLFILCWGFASYSQECQPPTVNVQVQSFTCPEGISIAVIAENISDFTQVLFEVTNLTTNQTESFGIMLNEGETDIGLNFGPYPSGTELRIIVIGITSEELFCASEPLNFTIPSCSETDLDGDGYNAIDDCNDNNASINPGAEEKCNRIDDNCNNEVDEGVNYIFYYDEDQDGFGDPLRPIPSCQSTPTGFLVDDNTDCDDKEITTYPDAPEECDGIDNNCDGIIDEGCSCPDADNDGICDADDNCPNLANPSQEPDVDCDGVPTNIDCDDTDNTITSTNENDADCDGVPTGLDCDDSDDTVTNTNENDADCDGVQTSIDCDDSDATITSTNENDADCDGVPTGLDCDDSDDTITSTNENDADCDGIPTSEDCNDNDPNIGSNANDIDCDGYLDFEDCDDENPDINPGSAEVCGNGLDDNCNGEVDEGCGCPGDADCDGYLTSEDCDDINPDVNPGSTEKCNNGIDDNCDSQVDEKCNACIDDDADGICDDIDNCPTLFNPEQKPDGDCDGISTGVDCNDNDATVLDRLDVDSDRDGIADCNDQEINSECPSLVDMKGVSIDSDKDGTPNCLDECPNDRNSTTAPCPCTSTKDTDNDGISDCYDLELRSPCPGEVNIQGVSKDDDQDGVPNCQDVCPNGDDKIDTDKDKIPDACDLSSDVRGEPICHLGNNGTSKTIYVSPQQKARHLAHGDLVGPCTAAASQEFSADVNTLSAEQVVLYPNPASQELNVQVNSSLSSGAVLSVHDFSGHTFIQIPVSGGSLYTIELDNRFVAGMYFVKITNGNTEITKQFVVKQ